MASITDICNRALQAIGTRSTIANLTEGSNESINCNLLYDPTRQQLLRAANWNFAKEMQTLTLLLAQPGTPENPNLPVNQQWVQGQQPPLPWLYEYAYPTNCLRVQRIVPQSLATYPGIPLFSIPTMAGLTNSLPFIKFEVGTDYLLGTQQTVVLTNLENALIIYTIDFTNSMLFDPDFTESLVAAMAGKLALALTGDKALAKMKLEEANNMIIASRVTDGNEGITIQNHTPGWISTRGYTASWQFDSPFMAPFGALFTLPI